MAIATPTVDDEGNPRYYWDTTNKFEAKEAALSKRERGQFAPFDDSTHRVIDSFQGVIAYTGTEELAKGFTEWLNANPQPVEVHPVEPLAEWEQDLLLGYIYRKGADGSGYIIRNRKVEGRFDLGDAFQAIRQHTEWTGVVLLSTTYWTKGVETGWQGADEVRWHFVSY